VSGVTSSIETTAAAICEGFLAEILSVTFLSEDFVFLGV